MADCKCLPVRPNTVGTNACCRCRNAKLATQIATEFKIDNGGLVTRPKYPPHRETRVAIPLSHCVSYGIADYSCYTPTSFRKNDLSRSKDRPNKGVAQKRLVPEAYRATGGVT